MMPHLTRARVPTWSGLGSTTSRSAAGSRPSDLVTVPRHILYSIREQAYQVMTPIIDRDRREQAYQLMARIEELANPEPGCSEEAEDVPFTPGYSTRVKAEPSYSEGECSREGRLSDAACDRSGKPMGPASRRDGPTDVERDRYGRPVERGRSSGAPRPRPSKQEPRRGREPSQEPHRAREPTQEPRRVREPTREPRRVRAPTQEPRRGREPSRSRSHRGRGRRDGGDPFTKREPAGHAMSRSTPFQAEMDRAMRTTAKAPMPAKTLAP